MGFSIDQPADNEIVKITIDSIEVDAVTLTVKIKTAEGWEHFTQMRLGTGYTLTVVGEKKQENGYSGNP